MRDALLFLVLTPFAVGIILVDWALPGPHELTWQGWLNFWGVEL